jgi:molybdopterin-guanine dinucleotide biosynthesis protein A
VTTLATILNGGMSTRMGQDKADVLVSDLTMLEMVSAALRSVSDRIVLLGPDREGWEAWPDSIHAHGPLAGITTALNRTDSDHILVVAVDHPFVRGETLAKLLKGAGDIPVVPVDDHGVPQVTCAVYPKAISQVAVEEAELGGSIQSLLDRVSFEAIAPDVWKSWGEDGRSWFSVDSQDALGEALARYQM